MHAHVFRDSSQGVSCWRLCELPVVTKRVVVLYSSRKAGGSKCTHSCAHGVCVTTTTKYVNLLQNARKPDSSSRVTTIFSIGSLPSFQTKKRSSGLQARRSPIAYRPACHFVACHPCSRPIIIGLEQACRMHAVCAPLTPTLIQRPLNLRKVVRSFSLPTTRLYALEPQQVANPHSHWCADSRLYLDPFAVLLAPGGMALSPLCCQAGSRC